MKVGLTKKESDVYLYLANNRHPKNVGDIASRLRLHKGDTYRALKNLQSKGIVESTIDRPMGFIAVSIEKVLDLHIEAIRQQANSLEAEKKDVIAQLKSSTSEYPITNIEKFLILKGQRLIYAKCHQMGLEAKKDVLWLCSNYEGLKHDRNLVCDVKVKSLINISYKNIDLIKRLTESAIKAGINVETRCLDLKKEMTYNVLIEDDKSALLIWEPKIGEDRERVAFWTDSEVFVYVWRIFFESLWNNATDINERIKQLEKKISQRPTTTSSIV